MRRFITFKFLMLATLLLGPVGCFERSVETRAKMEKGREKINLPEELEEYGSYDKYRDKLFRERFAEKVSTERQDRRRARQTDEALKDGSLMEKFSGGAKAARRGKNRL